MVRYLTVDLHTLNVSSSEAAAILTLRQLIPQFSRSEAIALAAMLVHSYSLSLGRWVGISASRNFNQQLTTAVLQVSALSANSKLGIAIELLKSEVQERDEDKAKEVKDGGDILHGFGSGDCDPIYDDGFGRLHNNPKNED
jgi:hypothetical protein